MKRAYLFLLIAAGATAQEKTTWEDHVFSLMESSCVSCHNPDKAKGGLDLSSYSNLLKGGSSGGSVVPGDPDASLLYKVTAHLEEPFMPHKKDKLPDAQIALLKNWIAGGLLETASSKAKKAKKPGFNLALKVTSTGKPEGPPPMPEHLALEPHVLSERPAAISTMATSPWAPIAAVAGQKQALLYNTDTFDPLAVLPYDEGFIESLKFSSNGALLVAGGGRGGKSGRVIAWDVKTGRQVLKAGQEFDTILSADITADQTTVAVGSPSKLVKLHDTSDGEMLHNIKKHSDWVTAVAFSPDGVLLATGDRNGGVFIWETFSGNLFYTLNGNKGAITAISWRSDSNIVATASEDGSVRLFVMTNGREVKSWTGHGGGTSSVHFARNGQLVTCGRDKQVKIWAQDGKQIKAIGGFVDLPLEVAFTHNAKRIIVGDWLGNVTVWDVDSSKQVGTLSANPPSLASRLNAAQKHVAASEAGEKKAKQALEAVKAVTAAKAKQLSVEKVVVTTRTTEKQKADADLAVSKQKMVQATAARDASTMNLKVIQDKLAKTNSDLKTNETHLVNARTTQTKWKGEVASRTTQSGMLKTAADVANAGSAKLPEDATLKDAAAKAVTAWQAMEKALQEARTNDGAANGEVQKFEKLTSSLRQQSQLDTNASLAAKADLAKKEQVLKEAVTRVAVATKLSTAKASGLKAAKDAVSKSDAELKAQLEKEKAPAQAHVQAVSQLAGARKQVARWQAEQVNVGRHVELSSLGELDAEFGLLKDVSSGAKTVFEKAQAELVAVQKELADAPAKIQAAEKSLSDRKAIVVAESEKLGGLNRVVTEKEAFLQKTDAFVAELAARHAKEPANNELAQAETQLKDQVRASLLIDLNNAKGRVVAQQQTIETANTTVVSAETHLAAMKALPGKLPPIIQERTRIRDVKKAEFDKAYSVEVEFARKVDAQRKKVDELTGKYLAMLPK